MIKVVFYDRLDYILQKHSKFESTFYFVLLVGVFKNGHIGRISVAEQHQ
jgi:hypothetical protein